MKGKLALLVLVLSLALLASFCWAGELTPPSISPSVSGITATTTGQYSPDLPRPGDLQEVREFCPANAKVEWSKLKMLADRLFAEDWIQRCSPVWGPLPWSSRVTQTYGQCSEGESLLPIDAAHGQWRPGWTWRKDAITGVHLEKCYRNNDHNWVLTTFVLQPEPVVETRTVTNTVTLTEVKTVEVLKPYPVSVPVYLPARQYVSPPGIGPSQALPGCPIGMGFESETATETLLTGFVAVSVKSDQPTTSTCPPGPPTPPPNSPYCPTGTAPPPPSTGGAATPGTPGSGNQTPGLGDNNGQPAQPAPPPGYGSGNDTVQPGVGPGTPGGTTPGPEVPPTGGSPVTS